MKIGLIMQDFKFQNDLKDFDFLIGVDRGAYNAYLHNVYVDLAIGDFDSINDNELNLISKHSNIIKLNPIKDLTDTAEALEYAYKMSDDVVMLGGIEGKRIEHFIANICLLEKYPKLKMINENSLIYTIDKSHTLDTTYKFASFFAIKDVKNLCLSGFKYELNNYHLALYDSLCISNEIISEKNIVSFDSGIVLVILTNDDKKEVNKQEALA